MGEQRGGEQRTGDFIAVTSLGNVAAWEQFHSESVRTTKYDGPPSPSVTETATIRRPRRAVVHSDSRFPVSLSVDSGVLPVIFGTFGR